MKILEIFKFALLSPLSFLWEQVYRIRRNLYEYGVLKRAYFKVPVISVGNITFGGTGKTPFIIWLTEYFHREAMTAAVLTRGYKGNLENNSGVIKSGQTFRSNPVDYGDEPLLISRRMKSGAVIVGKKRSQNLKRYFSEINPDVVLLDDGFQHLELYRSFNILLFDATLPIKQYQVAPRGYLREGLTALKDADAIVLSRCDQVSPNRIKELTDFIAPYHHPDIPMVKIRYIPTGLYNTYYKKIFEIEDIKGLKVIAVAAIASPESFYQLLESLGAEVLDKVSFPDHHFFTPEDINELLIKASKHDAVVVTSEKDMVKMRRIGQDSRLMCLNVLVEFLDGEAALTTEMRKILKSTNKQNIGVHY
ncbi:MAG: tetraacyldisaccharide 4'-kinase [Bacteriovoracaceae bacterium]|nr:tetraacyldisaccharide 4'-kinase [Bacteriovoracaceae bacterium]